MIPTTSPLSVCNNCGGAGVRCMSGAAEIKTKSRRG